MDDRSFRFINTLDQRKSLVPLPADSWSAIYIYPPRDSTYASTTELIQCSDLVQKVEWKYMLSTFLSLRM